MNRAIRFRAYNPKIKSFLIWFDLSNAGKIVSSNLEETYDGWENDCIIEQYTGLKDKNGKKIYEGDIIRSGAIIASIAFNEDIAAFSLNGESPIYKILKIDSDRTLPTAEIIGNIHEDSDLLEGEK